MTTCMTYYKHIFRAEGTRGAGKENVEGKKNKHRAFKMQFYSLSFFLLLNYKAYVSQIKKKDFLKNLNLTIFSLELKKYHCTTCL